VICGTRARTWTSWCPAWPTTPGRRQTPAQGWTIAHQIAHLAWTDGQSLLAVTDPDAFAREVANAMTSLDTYVDEAAEQGAALPPPELLARWRSSRAQLAAALTAQPPGARFPWYGTAMSTASVLPVA